MRYIVKNIQEADFGCEERPNGVGAMVLLRLRDESNQEINMEVADAELLAKDINEYDWIWRQNKKVTLKKVMPQQDAEKAIKLEKEIEDLHVTGEDKEAVVKVRVNQGIFRDKLLHRYHKCCLCNVNLSGLLVASHIKPWAVCTPEERLDINNGLIFCPTHDKLFDKGYISFDDNGRILISDEMDKINQTFCNINSDMSVEVNDKQKDYLEYHRKMFG